MEEALRKTKTLGKADDDLDDLAKWVTKSRSREEEEKESAREEALAAALRQAQQVRQLLQPLHAQPAHLQLLIFPALM